MTFGKSNRQTGTALHEGSRLFFLAAALVLLSGCTIFANRPIQLMSDTSAAIRAAHDVQADTLAPELYRQANEWFFRAKHEYKFKNFKLAADFATKARLFAEQAEFQALKNGGKFNEPAPPELPPAQVGNHPPPPGMYATPEPVSAEQMEQIQNQRQGGSTGSPPSGGGGPSNLGSLPTP